MFICNCSDSLAYKGHPYPWPVEYKKIEICRIPIWMEVGFWVEIKDCEDAEILLVQEDCLEVGRKENEFPCYKGCTNIRVRTNFEASLDGDVSGEQIEMSAKERFTGAGQTDKEPLILPGDGNWHEIEACVIAYNVELWDFHPAAGTKEEIAYLKIRIKPTGSPP
ncbi:MAG: hypothetical protein ACYS9C_17625 [Planctomycetota bacterium]